MAVLSIPSADVLTLGLELVGFSRAHQCDHTANLRRFAAHFGACPKTRDVFRYFCWLQTTQSATARIAKPQVFDLLMTLFWLKTYPTKHQTAGTFHVGEKTVRNNVWKYIQAVFKRSRAWRYKSQNAAETESLNILNITNNNTVWTYAFILTN
jgi:hypothetical protein